MEVKKMLNKEIRNELKAAATAAAVQATVAGRNGLRRVSDRLREAGDAALVEIGERARERMERRARKQTRKKVLKTVGRVALVAGVTAAGVAATRALRGRT